MINQKSGENTRAPCAQRKLAACDKKTSFGDLVAVKGDFKQFFKNLRHLHSELISAVFANPIISCLLLLAFFINAEE